MKTVKEKLSNTLSDFAQEKSDNVAIEATQFEILEKTYSEYLNEEKGESFIIELVEQMCIESLNPSLYRYWLIIKDVLSTNRVGLIRERQIETEAIEARDKLATDTLNYLKLLARDTGADTPDWDDAIVCCHLD